MRQDIEFDAEGTTLRGWLYVPDGAAGPAPTIVMCHGYSAVKELFLDAFAEVFCEAGFCALVYDNRNLGASDGEPRQEIDPWKQMRDYRHAITYARTRDGGRRRPDRHLGLELQRRARARRGAIDRRVKCVVAQVPLISGDENARRLVRADLIAPTQADVRRRPRGPLPRRAAGDDPGRGAGGLAVRAADRRLLRVVHGAGERARRRGATRCTLRSVEMFWEYEPGHYLPWISPTPLLMVVAAGDHLTVSDLAIGAFERAREPKRLEILPGGTSTPTRDFEHSSGAARDWFAEHLLAGSRCRLRGERRAEMAFGAARRTGRQRPAVRAGRDHQAKYAWILVPGPRLGDLDVMGQVDDQRDPEAEPGQPGARAQPGRLGEASGDASPSRLAVTWTSPGRSRSR